MNVTKYKTRASALTSLTAVGALLMTGVAHADDISNNLDATVDATAEVMSLNVDGPDGLTTLYVAPTKGDDKNGCNLTGKTTLTVAVSSSNAAVATVSPGSTRFDSCGDLKTLTVRPVSAGSATVTVSETDNTTGRTFNFAPATFTVSVTDAAPANTAPVVAVSGVTEGASYDKGSVPAATCDVTDVEDGNRSFAATLSAVTGPYASDGIGSQTASCSYTDAGGLTTAASKTYSIVDPSAPAVSYTLNPEAPDGNNGWYTGDVSLDWTVSEPESPTSLDETACVDRFITVDQAATTYSCTATSAGGSATVETVAVKRDGTAPVVSLSGAPAGSYYFGGVPAAPTCTASDALSGLDGTCSVSGYSSAVGTHTVTATVTDMAGNTASDSSSYAVLAWTLNGFYSPVDMGGVWNTVKGGSTVPLKFQLFAGPTEMTTTSAVASFTTKRVSCTTGASTGDAIEAVSTGGTSLRYDTTGGQFIQNWKTPTAAGTCHSVTVTTQDGSSITANFKLK